jgi:hypothetical protein
MRTQTLASNHTPPVREFTARPRSLKRGRGEPGVSVVPHLSISPIDQLAYSFPAARQFRQIDQLVPN